MPIITEKVEIGLYGSNISFYEKKGYAIPRNERGQVPLNTPISVLVEDLPSNSGVIVEIKCPKCGETRTATYRSYVKKRGKDTCLSCEGKIPDNAVATREAILNFLKDGPKLCTDLQLHMEKKGFTPAQVQGARRVLKLPVTHMGRGGGRIPWIALSVEDFETIEQPVQEMNKNQQKVIAELVGEGFFDRVSSAFLRSHGLGRKWFDDYRQEAMLAGCLGILKITTPDIKDDRLRSHLIAYINFVLLEFLNNANHVVKNAEGIRDEEPGEYDLVDNELEQSVIDALDKEETLKRIEKVLTPQEVLFISDFYGFNEDFIPLSREEMAKKYGMNKKSVISRVSALNIKIRKMIGA